MTKRVYISADYSEENGDREVVELLIKWGSDNLHIVDFIDMAQVASGSVAENPDCRPCDLKLEFNRQINASSSVIFVVGDKTAYRQAGSSCSWPNGRFYGCTPYKQNSNGRKSCKVDCKPLYSGDISNINEYSYLRHEFEQAKKCGKDIIILYNSLRKESAWLPNYMRDYEESAQPFWIRNEFLEIVGDYNYIKRRLGYGGYF